MDEFAELALREREARRIAKRQWFWLHFAVYLSIQVFLIVIWYLEGQGHPWFIYPIFGWGIVVVAHAVYAFVIQDPEEIMVQRARERESNGS